MIIERTPIEIDDRKIANIVIEKVLTDLSESTNMLVSISDYVEDMVWDLDEADLLSNAEINTITEEICKTIKFRLQALVEAISKANC